MFTYTVLALLLAIASVNSQKTTTYFAGCTSSSNCTWSYPEHWTNGVPDENSIVVINETGCPYCDIDIDIEIVVIAELHLRNEGTTGPRLFVAGNLTITDSFVFGSVGQNYDSFIRFASPTAILHLKGDTTLVCSSNYPFAVWASGDKGLIVNEGTITVVPYSDKITSYIYSYFTDSDVSFENWGNWVIDSPLVAVYFSSSGEYTHYAGSYNTTFAEGSSNTANLQFRNTPFSIQSSDFVFNGPVYFYSSSSNSIGTIYTGITPVTVNATGVTISNCDFYGVNIIFEQDGSIENSNFTYYTTVNTTAGAKVTLKGKTMIYYGFFSGLDAPLVVENDADSEIDITTLSVWGNVHFINYGTAYLSGTLYIDIDAFLVNAGLIQQISQSVSFSPSGLKASSTGVGTVVNKGTIELSQSSSFYWSTSYPGDFYQCGTAWIKIALGYPASTDSFGYMTFSGAYIDGYISPYFGKGYTLTSYSLFNYDATQFDQNKGIFEGDLDLWSTWNDIKDLKTQVICVSDSGYVYSYPSKDGCPKSSTYTTFKPSLLASPVCESDALPAEVKAIVPTCEISKKCGGIPADTPPLTPNPPPPGNSASGSVASITLLASSLAVLYRLF